MTTKEIADKLVSYCRVGDWDKALEELYSDQAVSIEPAGSNFPERTEGMENIKAKGAQWEGMVEQFHGVEIDGPLVADDHFSCTMKMDITMKGMPRMKNEEICVYKVEDGKIVSEQFFYKI